jgi:tetratricopeptide (TPR) repeat protein
MTAEVPSPSPSARTRWTLAAVAAAGALATFAACVVRVRDPDLFHHLALGRHLVRNGLGGAEPFLFPLLGAPVGVPTYWLGSVALYGWHVLLGDAGLALLPALVGALLFLVLLADSAPRRALDESPPGLAWLATAALPLALALETYRFRATARPEILGMLFLALTALAVRRTEEGRPRLFLAFPLLALLWTNVHPSVVAGLLVAGLHALSALARRGTWRERLLPAGVVLAAALAAGLNPSPANPVAEALRFGRTLLAGSGGSVGAAGPAPEYAAVRLLIGELVPPGRADLASPAVLLLLLTAASFVAAWRRPRLRELVAVAAFAFLFSRAIRFGAFLAVSCAPIAARNLADAVSRLPERAAWLGRLRAGPRALAAGVLALVAAVHPVAYASPPQLSFGTGRWPGAYPVRGADYLASIGFDGRVFDTFHFGGYLEWRGFHPYQDGRGAVPSGTLEASLLGPERPDTFAALDGRFRFDALLLQYPANPLDARPESLRALEAGRDRLADRAVWALVAFDDGGLLYLRRDGRYGALAARDEYRLARPANASLELTRATLPLALAEYERAIRESPSCARCRHLYATCALAGGRPADALRVVEPVLPTDAGRMPELLLDAARAHEGLGDPARARERYARFLELGGDDPEARRGLARTALALGDPGGAERALRPLLAGPARAAGDLELAAQAAQARGRPEEAAALLRSVPADGGMAVAREQFDRALAAEAAGDLAGAAAAYQASLVAFERNPAAYSNLGYVLQKLGRLDDAIRSQRRAAELDPRLAAAQYGLGSALADRGDRAEAAAALRRYLALEPQGYWALQATRRVEELERR